MIIVMQINNPKLVPKITNATITYIISLPEIYKIFLGIQGEVKHWWEDSINGP